MRFGYETTDSIGTGLPAELRGRETMAGQRRYSDIGRPRGAAARAAAQCGGQDEATLAMRTELAQAELEDRRRRMRLLELTR